MNKFLAPVVAVVCVGSWGSVAEAKPPRYGLGQASLGLQAMSASSHNPDGYIDSANFGFDGVATYSFFRALFGDPRSRLQIGDVEGGHVVIDYSTGKYEAFISAGFFVGLGGVFAINDDVDAGLKFVAEMRLNLYGVKINSTLGFLIPTLSARYKDWYADLGFSASTFGGAPDNYLAASGRYLISTDTNEWHLGVRLEYSSHSFGPGARVDTNLGATLQVGLGL